AWQSCATFRSTGYLLLTTGYLPIHNRMWSFRCEPGYKQGAFWGAPAGAGPKPVRGGLQAPGALHLGYFHGPGSGTGTLGASLPAQPRFRRHCSSQATSPAPPPADNRTGGRFAPFDRLWRVPVTWFGVNFKTGDRGARVRFGVG